MSDARIAQSAVLALLDNVAWQVQTLQAVSDGGFSGESTTTLLYAARYALATRLHALADGMDKAALAPPLNAWLKDLDQMLSSDTAAVRLIAAKLGPGLKALLSTIPQAHYPGDTSYPTFWAYWAANAAASPNDKILGEAADVLAASGMAPNPAYCVPPENTILAHLLYTGAGVCAVTQYNTIDPTRYTGHTVEVYCVARNVSPDEIHVSLNKCSGQGDSFVTPGAQVFSADILNSLTATQVVDMTPGVAGQFLHAVQTGTSTDGTVTNTSGGKTGDEFYLRVKRYRAAAV